MPTCPCFLVAGFIDPIPLDCKIHLNIQVFMLLLNTSKAENLKTNTFEEQIFSALHFFTFLPFHSVL